MKTRIILYDDNSDLRSSLVTLLKSVETNDVIASYPHPKNVLLDIQSTSPDVILMDISMPQMNGIDAIEVIRSKYPDVLIMIITVFEDAENIVHAIQAGANGYLLKSDIDRLNHSIANLMQGGAPLSSLIARKVLQSFRTETNKTKNILIENLSPREKEILHLLTKGNSYKMVSSELNISIETMRSHIKKIYKKLHVNSATEAVYKFNQQRIQQE